MHGPCPAPRIPFPRKPCSRLRIGEPHRYAQLPLVARALGARLYWDGPTLRVRGLDGSWVEVEGRGEPLELAGCLEPGSPCVWIPPGPSLEVYLELARLLGVPRGGEVLVNYSPQRYVGMVLGETPSKGSVVESVEGFTYSYLELEGGSSTGLEGVPAAEREVSRVSAGGYVYEASGGALTMSRGAAWASLEAGVGGLYEARGVGRAEAGGGNAFLTPSGVYVEGVELVTVRHGMYGGEYFWVQPFAEVSARGEALDLQSWWVCLEGSYAVCVASDGGVEVRARPGVMDVAARGRWVWLGLSRTPSRGAAGVAAASRSLRWPPARVSEGPRPGLQVWSLAPERFTVYDAVIDGDRVHLALLGLGEAGSVELRVAGRILEASLWDASLSEGEVLYPEHDLLTFSLGPGLEIVSLKVRRSPFIGLRRSPGG